MISGDHNKLVAARNDDSLSRRAGAPRATAAAELAAALGGQPAGGGWLCRCPLAAEHAHGDSDPSLHISDAADKLLVHCLTRHANEQDRIVEALRARHLWPSANGSGANDRQPAASRPGDGEQFEAVAPVPPTAPDPDGAAKQFYAKLISLGGETHRFGYCDASGKLLFCVYRFEPPDAPKEIRPLSLWRDRKSGTLTWRPKWPPALLPLFGLEKLAQSSDLPVLLVEGEKKAEAAAITLAARYVVLSIPSGAQSVGKVDFGSLANRRVILWPDNDQPGCAAMARAARKIESITHSVQIIKPDAAWPVGHDVADLIATGSGGPELIAYIEGNLLGIDDFDRLTREHFPSAAAPLTGDDAELDRLAKLSPFDYERARKEAAKKLGVRPTALDEEIKRLRPRAEADAGQLRESLVPLAPKPWPEAVSAGEVLDGLREFLRRFVIVDEHALTAITLWIAFTYFFEIAEISPRLAILSPTKRCGKTRVLELLTLLCPNAIAASNLTPSAIFRTIDQEKCVLLIDEADTFARRNDELRGLLNSGHTPVSAHVIRAVPVGERDYRSKKFSTWAPIAVAAIGKIPDTWIDRSIMIKMRRKHRAESVERLTRRNKAAREQASALASKLARLAADQAATIADADPEPPVLDSDRAIDNWAELLRVADLAGGGWPIRARAAAVALSGDRDGEAAGSLNVRLLADVGDILAETPAVDRIASADLCDRLNALSASPWATISRGRPLTQARLSAMLRDFEIYVFKSGDFRGYKSGDFREAISRYLPNPPDQSAQAPQTVLPVSENALFEAPGAGGLKNAPTPTESGAAGAWALQNGGEDTNHDFPASKTVVQAEIERLAEDDTDAEDF